MNSRTAWNGLPAAPTTPSAAAATTTPAGPFGLSSRSAPSPRRRVLGQGSARGGEVGTPDYGRRPELTRRG